VKREAKSSRDIFEGFEGPFRNLHIFSRTLRERREFNQRVYIVQRPANKRLVKEQFRVLANSLCVEHPFISIDTEIVGGSPHIKNTRLSVGTVLAKLYLHGSVQAIVDIYEPHLSEEQVKDAIAFAQDFLEIACDPNEPQSNG
jgi:uncharacterized protein (DUF433 family)